MNRNKDSERTFGEIAAQEGEEAAIQAGIEADHDAFELGAEWFRHAIPAREFIPYTRASYSWISSDDRTNFKLSVDDMLVATGQVSQNRDQFSITSVLDETTHSFHTMRDTKSWAIEHFDFHNALPVLPPTSTSRARYSWISSDDRTYFRLFVDGTLVAKGKVTERRDLFSIVSQLNGTARSFRTMQAAKNWAIEQFDSLHIYQTTPHSSKLRAAFAWNSSNDRDKFRLFVNKMLVAEGQVCEQREMFSLLSKLDGTRRLFRTMVAAKKWVISHYCSVHSGVQKGFNSDSQ